MAAPSTSPFPPTFRVLVVEDEEKTRVAIVDGFAAEGWIACGEEDGQHALARIDEQRFDLIVLDWMLPGLDGLEFLRHLRGRPSAPPVLMLTARQTVEDRVEGLEGGADDYLTKPFAFAELLARSRALLRRAAPPPTQVLRCADLTLDLGARIARRDGQEIPLTPRETDLLAYLLRCEGQVVTRDMLERDVWKQQRRLTSLDNVIDVQLMRLRRKIEAHGAPRILHTLRGIGYRLGPGPT